MDGRKRETDLLFQVLDSQGLAALVLDEEGVVVAMSQTAQNLLKYDPGDLCGRPVGDIFLNASGDGEGWSASLKTGGKRFEASCRRKDGETAVVSASCVELAPGQVVLVLADLEDRRKLQRRATQRTKELSVFASFADVLNRGGDRDRILADSVGALPALMGGCAAWAHMADHEELVMAVSTGGDEDYLARARRLAPGDCLIGKVFTSGRPLLVKNARNDPRVTHVDAAAAGLRSIASAPIVSRGVVQGVLSVASRRPGDFSSMDMQLLASLGSQLGVALDNATLVSELKEKVSQIELTNELSSTINSSLSIGTVFRIMVSEIKKFVRYDRASLLLYDRDRGDMEIFALDTLMKTDIGRGVRAPLEGTSAGWVIRNNRPWINRDLEKAMKFPLDGRLLREGIRATISIPLYQDRMLGVFNLDSREAGRFSDDDLGLLLPVAKHISIALENALLFEEISKEKKEWEKTFEAITDMVWIEDVGKRIVRLNRAVLKNVGWSRDNAVGRPCAELLRRIGIEERHCLCDGTWRTRRPSFREIAGPGGKTFDFWVYPLKDDEGRLYAVVHYVKDVTEQRRLEEQLVRTDKLASLGTLAAGIAHEINNPLGIIAGYAEALLERSEDERLARLPAFEDFPEYLNTIHKEIFRCKEILGSLLEFSRPHSIRSREIDVNELLKEVILLVNHKARRIHCTIEQDFDRDIPPICAEPGSLRQLFMNIIINAMFYTPENGSITISTGFASDRESPGMIQVAIGDTGPGIARAIQGKIFDPFFTTKPVGEGTGLGLAICHKIAEEHGGTIHVESDEGAGARFVVRLPAKEDARCPGQAAQGTVPLPSFDPR